MTLHINRDILPSTVDVAKNLLTVPTTAKLSLETQFMSRKIYVFLIIKIFVCYVKKILK